MRAMMSIIPKASMREGVFRNRSLTTSGSLRKEKSLSMPYSVNGIRHFITHFGIIGSFCLNLHATARIRRK
jgi:hypothetical protein